MKSGLHEISELLYLGVGDKGRLIHIKEQLLAQNKLYDSDQQYLDDLIIKYQDVMVKKSQKEEMGEEIEWEEKTEDKKDVIYGEDPFTSATSNDPTPDKEEFKNNFCSHCGNKIDNKNFCTNCGLQINKKTTNDVITSKESTEKKHSSHKGRNASIVIGVIVLLAGFSMLLLAGIETVSENDRTSDASLAKIEGFYNEDKSQLRIVLIFTDGDNGDTVRTSGKIDITISSNNDNSNPSYSETYTFKPDDFRTYNQATMGKTTSLVIYIDKYFEGGHHYLNSQVKLSDGSTWRNLSDKFYSSN